MAHEPEEVRTDYEEDGGPVKSFLEHLEDLRWTLIKSAAAVAVGMVLCLISGDTIVRILKRGEKLKMAVDLQVEFFDKDPMDGGMDGDGDGMDGD